MYETWIRLCQYFTMCIYHQYGRGSLSTDHIIQLILSVSKIAAASEAIGAQLARFASGRPSIEKLQYVRTGRPTSPPFVITPWKDLIP